MREINNDQDLWDILKRDKTDIDAIKNKKLTVYVETLDQIIQKCLDNAKHENEKDLYKGIFNLITLHFSGTLPDAKVLRNLHGKMKALKASDGYDADVTIDLYLRNFVILAKISGIRHIKVFERGYLVSFSMPVLFTPKPWSFFNLIRVAENGLVSQKLGKWEYTGSLGTKISGSVTGVRDFTMPGDKESLWIELSYSHNGLAHIAYFAEQTDQIITPAAKQGALLVFFKNSVNK